MSGHAETARHLVVVDCESSGLRDKDFAVEVAWRNLSTGEHGYFVPVHSVDWVLKYGQPEALAINGYQDRLITAKQDHDQMGVAYLDEVLKGNVLAGSNPRADAGWLEKAFEVDPGGGPWHHRLLDLSAYAAGVLGLDPRNLPGLARVCELLGVDPEPEVHTAQAGVDTATACFLALLVKAGVQL